MNISAIIPEQLKGTSGIPSACHLISNVTNESVIEYLGDDIKATEGNNRYPISVLLNSDVANKSTIDKLYKYSPVGRTLSNSLGLTAPCSVG